MTRSNAQTKNFRQGCLGTLAAPQMYARLMVDMVMAIAQRRSALRLSPQVLYDVGESDCRPLPMSLQEKALACQQQALEAMKLRSF